MSNELQKNYIYNKEIYICGKFDDSITELYGPIRDLIKTNGEKAVKKLVFNINSPGGSVNILFGLLGIIEEAREKGFIIETNILGYAYSAAALLAIAGTEGHRSMSIYSTVLFHYGVMYAEPKSLTQATNEAEHWNNLSSIYVDHINHYTNEKLTPNVIEKLLTHDSAYIYPVECAHYGVIDKTIGQNIGQVKSGYLTKITKAKNPKQ